MGLIKKYGFSCNVTDSFNNVPFKNKKLQILLKIFDRPARKALVLISNVITYNEWCFSGTSSKKKYKLILDRLFTMNFGHIGLYIFV